MRGKGGDATAVRFSVLQKICSLPSNCMARTEPQALPPPPLHTQLLDSKHVGLLVLKLGPLTDHGTVTLTRGLLAGQSGPDVCGLCNWRNSTHHDPGCHPKLSRFSFNPSSPFHPTVALAGAAFGTAFSPGGRGGER